MKEKSPLVHLPATEFRQPFFHVFGFWHGEAYQAFCNLADGAGVSFRCYIRLKHALSSAIHLPISWKLPGAKGKTGRDRKRSVFFRLKIQVILCINCFIVYKLFLRSAKNTIGVRMVGSKTHIDTGFQMRSLVPFSGTHLRCACLCANRCKEIEQEFKDGNTTRNKNDLHQEDMAYACGAVISSVAFQEATINEFFQWIFYKFDELNINQSELKDLKCDWDYGKPSKILFSSIEDKYDKYAYGRILNKKLDRNSKLWDDFKNLILLRNSLVHFKAKWQNELSRTDNEYGLEHLGKRFKRNPFMEDAGNRDFPKRLLNAECAVWSINVSTKFRSMFFKDLSDSNIDIILGPDINKILCQYFIETN